MLTCLLVWFIVAFTLFFLFCLPRTFMSICPEISYANPATLDWTDKRTDLGFRVPNIAESTLVLGYPVASFSVECSVFPFWWSSSYPTWTTKFSSLVYFHISLYRIAAPAIIQSIILNHSIYLQFMADQCSYILWLIVFLGMYTYYISSYQSCILGCFFPLQSQSSFF